MINLMKAKYVKWDDIGEGDETCVLTDTEESTYWGAELQCHSSCFNRKIATNIGNGKTYIDILRGLRGCIMMCR